ncbi:MAG: hypothetical protein ABEJ08_01160 [Halobacteriaceae archaeon]
MKRDEIEIGGTEVRAGTSVYDTVHDRVLWISDVDDYELTVEAVQPYEDDEPIWWSPEDDPTWVEDGSSIGVDKFTSLVEDGRFEVGPQPLSA